MRLDGRGAEPVTVCEANIIWREARSGTKKEQSFSELLYGSPNWARTSDIMINSHALYRLSYRGISVLHSLKLCIENRTRKETNEVKLWKLELLFR